MAAFCTLSVTLSCAGDTDLTELRAGSGDAPDHLAMHRQAIVARVNCSGGHCGADAPVIYGSSLPERHVALTYDDGPDVRTLDLATYLRDSGVKATFFINGCMIAGQPACPEHSRQVPASTLNQLVSLGHRLANHTQTHVVLPGQTGSVVLNEVFATQALVDPHITDGYYFFRPPKGHFSVGNADVIRTQSSLNKLIGPVMWNTEPIRQGQGDWNCVQLLINQGRTKPQAVTECGNFIWQGIQAQTAEGHGSLVLLHDRQLEGFGGGLDHALLLAQHLVPILQANGYIFVPVDAIPDVPGLSSSVGSSLWSPQYSDAANWHTSRSYYGTIRFADLNNDANERADVCGRAADGIWCATSTGSAFTGFGRWTNQEFTDAFGWGPDKYSRTIQLGDITGDGRADICGRGLAGLVCAVSTGSNFSAPAVWSKNGDFGDSDTVAAPSGWDSNAGYYGTIRLGDIDGDGDADVCGRGSGGIWCAKSNRLSNQGFSPKTLWKSNDFRDDGGWLPEAYSTTLQLADVNGDGAADICGRGGVNNGIACALSNGSSAFGSTLWTNGVFTDPEGWDDAPSLYRSIRFADISGDGKIDVCGRNVTGVACAVGKGNGTFERYRYLNNSEYGDAQAWGPEHYGSTLGIANVGGTGKADICARGALGIRCSLTP